MADTQVRQININVKTSGDASIKSLKNQFKEMNTTLKGTKDTLASFKNIATGLFAANIFGVGVQQVTNLIDSMQKLEDRLVTTEGSMENALVTLGKLNAVSSYTKTGIEDTAQAYSRLSFSLKETGLSTDAVLGLTIALRNSYRVSGASAEEAAGSTIQLTQALAQGGLQGQELRSVLQGNVLVGDALAKQLKVTKGELRKIAEKNGGISTRDVLQAIAAAMDDINSKAEKLRPTIGESLSLAFNDLKISVAELNDEFKITSKIADGIKFVADNLKDLAISAGLAFVYFKSSTIIALFGTAMGALGTAVGSLSLAFETLAAIGGAVVGFFSAPLLAGLTAVAAIIYTVVQYNGGLNKVLKDQAEILVKLFPSLNSWAVALGLVETSSEGITVNMEEISKSAKVAYENLSPKYSGLLDEFKEFASQGVGPVQKAINALKEESKTIKPKKDTTPVTIAQQIKKLNESFNAGRTPLAEYNIRIKELTEKMYSGKNGNTLHDALHKVDLESLNRNFQAGVINVTQYDAALKSLKIEELTYKVNAGRISLAEYHKEMNAISDKFMAGSAVYQGINDYITSSGTLAQNIAGNITLVFNSLEDVLFNFTKTGVFRFHEMTKAILDDLTRIILRAAIIQPLASGILGAMTPTASATTPYNAGGARPMERYAAGGIVSRTTPFLNSGKPAVMGENGKEAIMPLKRDASGNLGVSGGGSSTTVNIINNTGAEISQSESTGSGGEKILDIIIANKTKELFASGGMDRTMRQVYGVSRRGN
jgi:tape measure domain-containing protein